MRVLCAVLVCLSLASPAAAEIFSIRCEARPANKVYILTFDTERKAVIYESSSGNSHHGRITKADDTSISFVLRADDDREIPASYSRYQAPWGSTSLTLHWPGFWDDAARPTRDDRCVPSEPRTVLAGLREEHAVAPPATAPFSLRCASEPVLTHFTFDRAAKHLVMESMSGMGYRGKIEEATDNLIRFTVDIGERVSSITWDRQAANITIEGVPGDSSRPTKVIACSEIAPRSIMVFWKPLN